MNAVSRAITVVMMFVALGVSGCATLDDAKAARGTGSAKVYDVTLDDMWKIMRDVIVQAKLEYVSENRIDGHMLAKRGMGMWSYGEEVAIFITAVEDKKIRVEIVSKKVMSTNIFAPDWSEKLFKLLDERFAAKNL